MKNNKRSLFILKYLTEQTDEKHLATITNINEYLRQYDLDANRETISDCIKELQEVGYDIFCVRSTQNQYYMRERPFIGLRLYCTKECSTTVSMRRHALCLRIPVTFTEG